MNSLGLSNATSVSSKSDYKFEIRNSVPLKNLTTFFTKNEPLFSVPPGEKANLTSHGGMRLGLTGSYKIGGTYLNELFDLLEESRRKDAQWHMSERQSCSRNPDTKNGLYIDLDIKQYSIERIVSKDIIRKLLARLMIILKKCLKYRDEFSATFFVLTRNEITVANNTKPGHLNDGKLPTMDDLTNISFNGNETIEESFKQQYRDGIHILVPDIFVNLHTRLHIVNELTSYIPKAFESIAADIANLPAVLDKAAIRVSAMLYGARKEFDSTYYKLSFAEHRTYNADEEQTTSEPYIFPDGANLVKELSIAHKFVGSALIKNDYEEKTEIVPRATLALNEEYIDYDTEERVVGTNNGADDHREVDKEYFLSLLNILPPQYYEDYTEWFKVLCVCHSCNMKEEARIFSMKSKSKYNNAEFEQKWIDLGKQSTGKPLTLGSLIYWARQADPVAFEECRKKIMNKNIYVRALASDGEMGHFDFAEVIYKCLAHVYVCTDDPDNDRSLVWYAFDNGELDTMYNINRWDIADMKYRRNKWQMLRRNLRAPEVFYKYAYDHLPKICEEVRDIIKTKADSAANNVDLTDKNANAELLDRSKAFANVLRNFKRSIKNLKQTPFLDNVMSACQKLFIFDRFASLLDKEPLMLGTGNGIVTLGRTAQFCVGSPYHHISMRTQAIYTPFDPQNEWVIKVQKMFSNIFIERDMYHWFLFYLSTALDAQLARPLLLMICGGGSNGKSSIMKAIATMMGGEYSCKIPVQLLTDRREKAADANSALMRISRKRFVYFSEPDSDMSLSEGRIKELVGGENISGRQLYSRQEEFECTATFVCCSNYDFHTDCRDHGLWRRLRYYQSKNVFKENPDPKNKYEVKIDRNYLYEYPNNPQFQSALLSLLVRYNEVLHNHFDYSIEKVPCPTLEQESERYRNRQDSINGFIANRVVRMSPERAASIEAHKREYGYDAEHDGEIPLKLLATKYISWYQEKISNTIRPLLGKVIAELENSCLASNIIKKSNGDTFLLNHRYLDDGDMCGPDETYIAGDKKTFASINCDDIDHLVGGL